MLRLYILTLFTVICSGVIFFNKKRAATTIEEGNGLLINKVWLAVNKNPITTPKDMRSADQTFLTFPEWYLVFSPEEQANYFKKYTATSFPYMSHTRQIWESYRIVNNQIKDNFPTNKGYHFMIWVIGTSATVEYAIKHGYEKIVGRLTDTYSVKTEEDKFNAGFTEDYVDFIKDKPWYEFNFIGTLKKLWVSTSFFGDHFLRKIERKYILTSELMVKWAYAKLIGIGTKQVYNEALPTTAVVLNNDSIVYLPRYDKFNKAITALANKGNAFKEIAGNNSAILFTIITPNNYQPNFDSSTVIFTQSITSDTLFKRVAIVTPIKYLNNILVKCVEQHIAIEHVFDF